MGYEASEVHAAPVRYVIELFGILYDATLNHTGAYAEFSIEGGQPDARSNVGYQFA